jgi:peptidoglycan LD-endopeptidase CwlK
LRLKRKPRKFLKFLLLLIIVLSVYRFLTESKPVNELKKTKAVSYPTELHPLVKERSEQLIQEAANKGIVVIITDDFRSIEDQDRLYEQGRTTEGNIVTHAKGGESYHNFGLAIDFALKTPTDDVIWDMQYDGNGNGKSDWNEVVAIAKNLGFEWGGDWSQFKDYPHLQMNFGLSISELHKGEIPS